MPSSASFPPAIPAVPSARTGVLAAFILAISVALFSGCSTDGGEKKASGAKAERPSQTDSLARSLVTRYLSLSYRGGSLRSTHPLNDSLLAMTEGKGPGGPVLLVDTFYVKPEPTSRTDSSRTVRVRVPTALTVSRIWKTSNPKAKQTFTVEVKGKAVAGAPRIVGWPALRAHVLRVEPDSGKAIAERLRRKWTDLTGKRPGV